MLTRATDKGTDQAAIYGVNSGEPKKLCIPYYGP